MDRIKLPVAVHLFLIEGNKILLLRRYNTGYEDGNYSLVAGHIDGNENVIDAMKREALEEAGIEIESKDLNIVQVMHRRNNENDERIDYFLTCNQYKGKIRIMEPNKCDELNFFDINNLPKNTIPYIENAIENYRNKINFSLFGWN